MGIVDKIMDRFGTYSLHPGIEVLSKHIIHKTPFQVRVKLRNGDRKIRIDLLEVDLIWVEYGSSVVSGLDRFQLNNVINDHRLIKEHLIHKQKTQRPFDIAPRETFSIDLSFTTEKAEQYKFPEGFYLKTHVDIPKMVDINERKDIEVLPDIRVSAPMIAMEERLGFHALPRIRGDSSLPWNQWTLNPSSGLYPTLENVLLTVTDLEDEIMMIELDFRMRQNPNMPDKGISRDIKLSFEIAAYDIFGPEGEIPYGILSNQIHTLLKEAEFKFDEILVVERRSLDW